MNKNTVKNARYRRSHKRDRESLKLSYGFTLLELLVVLAILGLLAGLVGPQVINNLGESKTKTAMLQIEELSAALDIYKLQLGSYPSNEQGLQALITKPNGVERWKGPYLRKKVVRLDPWGREYSYRFPGEHGAFDLFSFGEDNAQGGENEAADVLGWE